MGKKKKKKNQFDKEYDYSRINYDGDIKKLMSNMADAYESFLDCMETYAIFEGMSIKKWKKNKKRVKKLIKKLRRGNPKVFNIDNLNEVLATNHQLVIGMD